jgi:hypothetical protein
MAEALARFRHVLPDLARSARMARSISRTLSAGGVLMRQAQHRPGSGAGGSQEAERLRCGLKLCPWHLEMVGAQGFEPWTR